MLEPKQIYQSDIPYRLVTSFSNIEVIDLVDWTLINDITDAIDTRGLHYPFGATPGFAYLIFTPKAIMSLSAILTAFLTIIMSGVWTTSMVPTEEQILWNFTARFQDQTTDDGTVGTMHGYQDPYSLRISPGYNGQIRTLLSLHSTLSLYIALAIYVRGFQHFDQFSIAHCIPNTTSTWNIAFCM